MDITVIANHLIVTGITINAAVFVDDEPDTIYLSNPLDKPIPVSFWKPEPIELTLNGVPLESLEISPNTLAKLTVEKGVVSITKTQGGTVKAIPLVPPRQLSAANWWNFAVDTSKSKKGFGYKQMRNLYYAELEKLKAFG